MYARKAIRLSCACPRKRQTGQKESSCSSPEVPDTSGTHIPPSSLNTRIKLIPRETSSLERRFPTSPWSWSPLACPIRAPGAAAGLSSRCVHLEEPRHRHTCSSGVREGAGVRRAQQWLSRSRTSGNGFGVKCQHVNCYWLLNKQQQ